MEMSTISRASLSMLPPELILHIVSFLDVNTTNRMRLVCGYFDKLCSEVVYKREQKLSAWRMKCLPVYFRHMARLKEENYRRMCWMQKKLLLSQVIVQVLKLLRFLMQNDMGEKCRFDAGKVLEDAERLSETMDEREEFLGAVESRIPTSFQRLRKVLYGLADDKIAPLFSVSFWLMIDIIQLSKSRRRFGRLQYLKHNIMTSRTESTRVNVLEEVCINPMVDAGTYRNAVGRCKLEIQKRLSRQCERIYTCRLSCRGYI